MIEFTATLTSIYLNGLSASILVCGTRTRDLSLAKATL